MPQQIGRQAAPRLQGLDALRGIAALTVVLYHFTLGYQDVLRQHRLGLLFVVSNGHFAVNLFFIISGFVIFMTLESSAGAADFAVSRFARLWPPYMACAALTGSVILFQHFNPLKLTVRDALLNALMMNRALAIVSIDPSYWTLTFEVLFYAGAAVTFFVLRVRRMEWACLAWLGVALAAKVSGFDARHARFGVILDADYCQFFCAWHDDLPDSETARYQIDYVNRVAGLCHESVWPFGQSGQRDALLFYGHDGWLWVGSLADRRDKAALPQCLAAAIFRRNLVLALPGTPDRRLLDNRKAGRPGLESKHRDTGGNSVRHRCGDMRAPGGRAAGTEGNPRLVSREG